MKKRFEFVTEKGTEIVIFAEVLSRSITKNVRVNGVWYHNFSTTEKNGVKCIRMEKGLIKVSLSIWDELEEMFADEEADYGGRF